MKGKTSMNQEVIKVELLAIDSDTDILRFHVDENDMDVNLNNATCQAEFKKVFSALIQKLIHADIELTLIIPEDYSRVMYREVCEEYINDLNRELVDTATKLRTELA